MARGAVVCLALLVASLTCSVAGKPPNILFILADDMGRWAMGASHNTEIITPHLDKLTAEGIRFRSAYSNTPVCSASRASYFTGRMPSQHGVHDWIAGGNGCDGHGINYTESETFYTDVLAKNGYTCGISGKYHLGNQPVPQHSFDHWFVHQSGGGDYNNPPMVRDGKCVNVEGYITDIVTDDAIDVISNHVKTGKEKPFYHSVHYTAPHSPYTGKDGKASSMHPPRIVDMYANCTFSFLPQEKMSPYAEHTGGLTRECLGNRECLLGYYSAVTAMDENVGRLMATLASLGIDEDTLVVFSSDHGFNAGQHGLWGKGNAVYPPNLFETSVMIPLTFRHKGSIMPGNTRDTVNVVDIGPTLLEYAGNFSYPSSINLAGSSFLPLLHGGRDRKREDAYSMVCMEYGQTRGVFSRQYMKAITRQFGHQELYYHDLDPNETTNVALSTGPSVVDFELSITRMRSWFSLIEDPYLSGWMLPVTGRGQLRAVTYNAAGQPNTPAFSPVYPHHSLQCPAKGGCEGNDLYDSFLSWWDVD